MSISATNLGRRCSSEANATFLPTNLDQHKWFSKFAQFDEQIKIEGLRFKHFQEFLQSVVYTYFERFPKEADKIAIQEKNSNGLDGKAANEKQANSEQLFIDGFTKQQEMHLFKKFDVNNDHIIDRDEFAHLCQRWLHQVFSPSCALIVVDVQNDFIDGSLALISGPAGQDGAEVVPIINNLVDTFQRSKASIVYTQDWHPQDHVSFHANLHLRKFTQMAPQYTNQSNSENGNKNQTHGSKGREAKEAPEPGRTSSTTTTLSNKIDEESSPSPATQGPNEVNGHKFKYERLVPKAEMFDTVFFEDGRVEQKLWPIHCVQNSWGAQLHPKLKMANEAIRIQKGTLSHVDAYSAFWDNMRMNETGLRRELVAKRVTDLFFCGLALDYCVAASALDATKSGFTTFIIEDACRGIDLQDIAARRQELVDSGAFIVKSDLAASYLNRQDFYAEAHSDANITTSKHCLSRDLIKTITYRKAFC